MDPEDKREVSGSCQVDILICERRGSCLHDSTAGETARQRCWRGVREGEEDPGATKTGRSRKEEEFSRIRNKLFQHRTESGHVKGMERGCQV